MITIVVEGGHTEKGKLHTHNDNTPMQYTANFDGCKNDNFQSKSFHYFRIFAQNKNNCGYMLEPHH